MKIEKLRIENFRIFKGVHVFDFAEKDLIIISGPNGNGKSTIFDAVQWCLSGKIPRYEGSNERQKFNYVMNESVYNAPETGKMSVEVWFKMEDGQKHVIHRSQRKSMESGGLGTSKIMVDEVSFNTVKRGEEAIRELLTNTELEVGIQEKGMNLSTFVSATQLLSQDALQDFIRDDKPGKRYELIDKILGVRKYGEDFEGFIKFAKEISQNRRDQIAKELIKPKKELEKNKIQLSEKENHLKLIGENSESELIVETSLLLDKLKIAGIGKVEEIIPLGQINQSIANSLIEFREITVRQRESFDVVKTKLLSSRDTISYTKDNYTAEKLEVVQQLRSLILKQERRAKGINIVQDRKNVLDGVRIRRRKYMQAKSDLAIIETKVNTKESERERIYGNSAIQEMKSNFSEPNLLIQKYNHHLIEKENLDLCLEYNGLSMTNELLEKQILNEVDANLGRQKNLSVITKNNLVISEKISVIEKAIGDRKESIASQLIRQVQEHLKHSDEQQDCPVCGTNFGIPDRLRAQVTEQIEKVNLELTTLDRQKLDLFAERTKLDEQIRVMKSEIKKGENVIRQNRSQLENTRVKMELLRAKLPEMFVNLKVDELLVKRKDSEQFLFQFKLAFELAKALVKIDGEIRELNVEVITKREEVEQHKSESKRWGNLLSFEESYFVKKLQVISNYLFKVEEESAVLTQEVIRLKHREAILEKKWNQRAQLIKEINEDLPGFEKEVSAFDFWVKKTNDQIALLHDLEMRVGTQLSRIQTYLSKSQIVELRNRIDMLTKGIEINEEELKRLDAFVGIELEALKEKHISVRSGLIGDYLLRHSDYIDQLFMQISPHAVYRHVQLVPKDKNLYIVMSKNSAKERDLRKLGEEQLKQEFNASLTFSSGQSNVLAVCIFLALNRSQKWSKLKLLGIDDPFQNLDEINVYSFIDVLSQVVSKQNKQVMISTHNDVFVHLMKMKMNIDPSRIGTIVFQAYSDRGVSVEGNVVSRESLS